MVPPPLRRSLSSGRQASGICCGFSEHETLSNHALQKLGLRSQELPTLTNSQGPGSTKSKHCFAVPWVGRQAVLRVSLSDEDGGNEWPCDTQPRDTVSLLFSGGNALNLFQGSSILCVDVMKSGRRWGWGWEANTQLVHAYQLI